MKRALLWSAAPIIVGHNHPSGNPDPSVDDARVTQDLKRVCREPEISLLDHPVLGEGWYLDSLSTVFTGNDKYPTILRSSSKAFLKGGHLPLEEL